MGTIFGNLDTGEVKERHLRGWRPKKGERWIELCHIDWRYFRGSYPDYHSAFCNSCLVYHFYDLNSDDKKVKYLLQKRFLDCKFSKFLYDEILKIFHKYSNQYKLPFSKTFYELSNKLKQILNENNLNKDRLLNLIENFLKDYAKQIKEKKRQKRQKYYLKLKKEFENEKEVAKIYAKFFRKKFKIKCRVKKFCYFYFPDLAPHLYFKKAENINENCWGLYFDNKLIAILKSKNGISEIIQIDKTKEE